MRKTISLLFVIVAAALAAPLLRASASDVCWLAPWLEAGHSGVLGFYYGGGLQCTTDRLQLTFGTRAAQAGNNVLQPVAAITYTAPLFDNWSLSLKTSLRERIGDYEVNALPELSLRWTAPADARGVQLSAAATWGSYAATTVPAIIQRTQVSTTATWPVWHIAPAIDAQFHVTGAYASYSTGDSQSWLQADFAMGGPLGRSVDWTWSVGDRNGFGVSPLKFDGNSGDAWTSAGLTFHVSPQWDVSIRGTLDFYTATMSSVQLEVRTTAFGDRTIGFVYDFTGGSVAGVYELPRVGNAALPHSQYGPSVSLFFHQNY